MSFLASHEVLNYISKSSHDHLKVALKHHWDLIFVPPLKHLFASRFILSFLQRKCLGTRVLLFSTKQEACFASLLSVVLLSLRSQASHEYLMRWLRLHHLRNFLSGPPFTQMPTSNLAHASGAFVWAHMTTSHVVCLAKCAGFFRSQKTISDLSCTD